METQRIEWHDDKLRAIREEAAERMEGRRRRVGPIGMKADAIRQAFVRQAVKVGWGLRLTNSVTVGLFWWAE